MKRDFRTSGYFSGTIIFLGIVLIFVGVPVILKSVIIGSIIFLVCIIIFTTHYRLTIDFDNKIFHDYLWILGLKSGDRGKFEHIEYLFVKKSKVSQKMNHLVASSTIRKEVYEGYLRFSENNKLHLTTEDSKKELMKKLSVISKKLNVSIIDYAEGDPK
jgi:hypothetical protein